MVNEKARIHYAGKMAPKKWYSGKELESLWGVDTAKRRNIVPALKVHCMISTTGRTSQIKYKVRLKSAWQVTKAKYVPPEKTGNGVIDAKLRKEANLPATTSSLENLIAAATTLGTENEVMRNKLDRIRAILDEV